MHLEQMSILIVDDQLINRLLLARLLETFNFPVLHAADGAEALRLYQQARGRVCLVFLDLMMPVLDGFRTALGMRRIEAERRWGSVPIVAYTSEDAARGSPTWMRCIESGFSDVVGKPIDKGFTYQLLARHIPFWAPRPLPGLPAPEAPSADACGTTRLEELGSPREACLAAPSPR